MVREGRARASSMISPTPTLAQDRLLRIRLDLGRQTHKRGPEARWRLTRCRRDPHGASGRWSWRRKARTSLFREVVRRHGFTDFDLIKWVIPVRQAHLYEHLDAKKPATRWPPGPSQRAGSSGSGAGGGVRASGASMSWGRAHLDFDPLGAANAIERNSRVTASIPRCSTLLIQTAFRRMPPAARPSTAGCWRARSGRSAGMRSSCWWASRSGSRSMRWARRPQGSHPGTPTLAAVWGRWAFLQRFC